MKWRIALLSLISTVIFLTGPVALIHAQEPIHIYFFWSQTCPHCAKEKIFLQNLGDQYPSIEIRSLEISKNSENAAFLSYVGKELAIDTRGVPLTIIGKHVIEGYLNDETTGKQIEEAIFFYQNNTDPDIIGSLLEHLNNTGNASHSPTPSVSETQSEQDSINTVPEPAIPDTLFFPLIGTIQPKLLSLPILTIVIALFDGFNPCAMWVLLFLISMLLGMKNKTRMWIIGSTFIIASGFVYFLFLSAWLNLFLFLEFVSWMRLAIGILAIGVGIYYVRDYLVHTDGGCSTAGAEQKKKIFHYIQDAIHQKSLLFAITGIILVAFFVNIIELVCSAGLPAIYTHILTLSNLSPFSYYGYLLLYIVIFMIDDMFVFVVAMTTLHAVGIQSKYARASRLIGSVVMLILGILLIFKPELIMFS